MRQRLSSVFERARSFGAVQFNRACTSYEAASTNQRRAFWGILALVLICLVSLPFLGDDDEKPASGSVATAKPSAAPPYTGSRRPSPSVRSTPPITQRGGQPVRSTPLALSAGTIIQRGDQPVISTAAQKKFAEHVVASGEFIISIASKLGVPWESIVVANETTLAARAAKRCAKLPESYRKKPGRRGHYCNELVVVGGKPMMAPNSLMPGDVLQIPSTTAPVAIQSAISNVKGNRIVVVIDDTGSMGDDRERVAAWYLQAVRNSGKTIVKVVLYANGYVRELDAGKVVLQTTGDYENTRSALERAATYRPDAIVLVTDEPGDDWRGFRDLRLPPVIVHSLNWSADVSLVQVARMTHGAFLRSHTGPIELGVR